MKSSENMQERSSLHCEKHYEYIGLYYCYNCNTIICASCKEIHRANSHSYDLIKEAAVILMKDLVNQTKTAPKIVDKLEEFLDKKAKKLRYFIKNMERDVINAFKKCDSEKNKSTGKVTVDILKKMNEFKAKEKYNELIILCTQLLKQKENQNAKTECLNKGKLLELNKTITKSVYKFMDEWTKISKEIQHEASTYEENKSKQNEIEKVAEENLFEFDDQEYVADFPDPVNEVHQISIVTQNKEKKTAINPTPDGVIIKEETKTEGENIKEEKKTETPKIDYENMIYSCYFDGYFLLCDIATKQANISFFDKNKDIRSCGSCKIQDKIYFAGGWNSMTDKRIRESAEYKIVNDLKVERRVLGSLIKPISSNTLVNVNNTFIYSIGGHNNDYVNYCEKYDITKNEWIHTRSLNEAKELVTAIFMQTRFIYSFGGYHIARIQYGVERLDTQAENRWEIVKFNDFPTESLTRYYHYKPAVKINENELIILGGTSNIKINLSTNICITLIEYEEIRENDNQNEVIYKGDNIYRIFHNNPILTCFNTKTNKYEPETYLKFKNSSYIYNCNIF